MGWPYVFHTPGHPELGEDYLKQLVQLRAARDPLGKVENLHWYYLSDQEPDEELIVKLFDSMSLGENAQEADVPFHGNPDIGVNGEGRESLEIQAFAFW